jgi:hypothetical protein
MRVFLACCLFWASSVQADESRQFQQLLDKREVRTVDELLEKIPRELGLFFTLAHRSESRQPGKRAILAGVGEKATALLLGVHETSPHGEAVFVEPSGKTTFHVLTHKAGEIMQVGPPNPDACARCHTKKFTFIFDSYSRWPNMVGAIDDQVLPADSDYLAAKKIARWNPLFALVAQNPLADRKVFPYNDGSDYNYGGSRRMATAPNFKISLLLQTLAAKKLYYEISHHPQYARYRAALMVLLTFPCSLASDLTDIVKREYAARVPKELRAWTEGALLGDVYRVLQLLGVNPGEIILHRPLVGKTVVKQRIDLEDQFYAGPLEYSSGAGHLPSKLAALLWRDVLHEAPPPPTDYSNDAFYEADVLRRLYAISGQADAHERCGEIQTIARKSLTGR